MENIGLLVLLLIGFGLGLLVGCIPQLENRYKQGQIDAINGVIKYELKKQDDNTTKWVKIKKEGEL